VSERSSGLDAFLDLFVYAPVGLALLASEELPKLAARGRAQLGGQLTMAKVVGQFAVAQGRRQMASRRSTSPTPPRPNQYAPPTPPVRTPSSPDRWPPSAPAGNHAPASSADGRPPTGDQAVASGDQRRGPPRGDQAQPPAGDRVDRGDMEDADLVNTLAPDGDVDRPPVVAAAAPAADDGGGTGDAAAEVVGEAASLAIPGYDSLAASQVVPRLAGLSAEELAAVGAYESAHRGRRTILNRVRQLQER
jgi:hypothetical protein